MAYQDQTKKSVKGLKPIEAGFVKYFEMIENAFKNINTSMGNLQMPEPKSNRRPTRRSPNRPYYQDAPNNPFIGR
tara:strand:+ start:471 stop:695 length:225 start_codon:yes stop_codon:yes gene_type:complete